VLKKANDCLLILTTKKSPISHKSIFSISIYVLQLVIHSIMVYQ